MIQNNNIISKIRIDLRRINLSQIVPYSNK